MYANHRHYILLTLAVITFVVTSFGFVYIRQRIYDQTINAQELSKETKRLEDEKSHEAEVKSVYAQIAEQRTVINSYIVPKDKIVHFIESVEAIGATTTSDIQLSNIATKDIVKGKKIEDNFTNMTAHVTAVGTWPNIMRSLTLVENLPYSISLSNLHLDINTAVDPDAVDLTATTSSKTAKKQSLWRLDFDIKVLILDNS
jgi:hypothetical protein